MLLFTTTYWSLAVHCCKQGEFVWTMSTPVIPLWQTICHRRQRGTAILGNHPGPGELLLTTWRAWPKGPPIFCLPDITGNGKCTQMYTRPARGCDLHTETFVTFIDETYQVLSLSLTALYRSMHMLYHNPCLQCNNNLYPFTIPSGIPLLPGCPPPGPGLSQHPGGWEEAAQDIRLWSLPRHTWVCVLLQGQDATEVDGTRDCDRECLHRQVWCVRTCPCMLLGQGCVLYSLPSES